MQNLKIALCSKSKVIKLLPHNIIKKKFNDCFLLSFLFIEKTIEKKINGNYVFKIDFLMT